MPSRLVRVLLSCVLTCAVSCAGKSDSDSKDDAAETGVQAYPGPCTSSLTDPLQPEPVVTQYEYDEQDRLISKEVDGLTTTYSYDTQGNIVVEERTGETPLTYRRTSTYDASGRRASQEYDEFSDDNIEFVIEYTYDATGNLATLTTSRPDGTEDVISYGYDGALLVSVEEDFLADGSIDTLTTYAYDDSGLRISKEVKAASGKVTMLCHYTYDVGGNLLKDECDTTGDGKSNQVITQTFDEVGNLLTRDDGDVTTYEYSCWK